MVLFNLNLQKMQIFFKDCYSDLAENLVRKLPVTLSKFNNNSTKQYHMNIEKSCHNLEPCNTTLETIKKILAWPDVSKAPGLDRISSKLLKNGAEVFMQSYNFVNKAIFISWSTDWKTKAPF